jgi:hypothetical protein
MTETRRTEIKFFPRITVMKSNSGWLVDKRVRPRTEPVSASRASRASCCNGFRCFLPLGSRQQDSDHVSSVAETAITVNDALEYPF